MVGPEFLDENPDFATVILRNLQQLPFETWLAIHSAMCDVDQSAGPTGCRVPSLVITVVITGEFALHFLTLPRPVSRYARSPNCSPMASSSCSRESAT